MHAVSDVSLAVLKGTGVSDERTMTSARVALAVIHEC